MLNINRTTNNKSKDAQQKRKQQKAHRDIQKHKRTQKTRYQPPIQETSKTSTTNRTKHTQRNTNNNHHTKHNQPKTNTTRKQHIPNSGICLHISTNKIHMTIYTHILIATEVCDHRAGWPQLFVTSHVAGSQMSSLYFQLKWEPTGTY